MEIERFFTPPHVEEYLKARSEQAALHIDIDFWDDHRERLKDIIIPEQDELEIVFGDVVKIAGKYTDTQSLHVLRERLMYLLPWRKGPFHLMGIDIDAEWRSDLKWNRIQTFLGSIQKQRVADIGCNNGYYMFRALHHDPECVIGFDPNGRFYYQFDLLQKFVRSEKLHYELLGVEHMPIFKDSFDTVLCMGVLYHRRDPMQCLQDLRECLRSSGKIILESITVPGPEDYCLFPKERYSKMRNVWFVPTESCLVSMMRRAGFRNVEVIDTTVTSISEQRKTTFAPYDSLEDFLDPQDHTKTAEGYPAPARTIVGAYAP